MEVLLVRDGQSESSGYGSKATVAAHPPATEAIEGQAAVDEVP